MMSDAPLLRRAQVFFNDVEVDTTIPPMVKGPYTTVMMAEYASMYGDFYPGHYDNKWAVETDRVPSALAHGYQIVTFLSQLMTDWISPDGVLKKLSAQVRAQTYVGDVLTFKGKVTKKYLSGGVGLVDCSVWADKPDGTVVVQGTATAELPSKAAGK